MNRAVLILVIIALALILSVACDNNKISDKPITYQPTPQLSITEIAVDGCEYLYSTAANGVILTHKGNCTNHKK